MKKIEAIIQSLKVDNLRVDLATEKIRNSSHTGKIAEGIIFVSASE